MQKMEIRKQRCALFIFAIITPVWYLNDREASSYTKRKFKKESWYSFLSSCTTRKNTGITIAYALYALYI